MKKYTTAKSKSDTGLQQSDFKSTYFFYVYLMMTVLFRLLYSWDLTRKLFLARLFEEYESYCSRPGVGVSVG
jgi:hypothetical protein